MMSNRININPWNTLKKVFFTFSLCVSTFSLFAQGGTVTGTVTDETGSPHPGANVIIKGTTTGVVTNADGQFSIKASPTDVLQISSVGYATQNIEVGDQTELNILLSEDSQALKEVVVVGYGTVKKATLTGAVAAITTDELVTTKTGNVQNAIAGKVAGVKIAQRTSEPGVFNNEFSIRGMGTPLVVIDGVPRDNMPRMDANEIESISFLKDASAAIYGTRAGNGVVLITTKKGAKNSKVHLDYNGYVGIEDFILKMQPLDAVGYMTLKNEQAYNNHQTDAVFTEEQIEQYRNGTLQSQDWLNPFINHHPMEQTHNLSVHGGNERVKFFTNLGYYSQEGIWKINSSNYKRYNLRANVSAEITKGLEAEVQLGLMQDHRNIQGEGTWRTLDGAYGQPSINPAFVDGDMNYPTEASNGRHPYVASNPAMTGYNWEKQRQVQTNLALNWDIPWVKGLKARGMYSYDYLGYEAKEFRLPMQMYNPDKTPGWTNSYIPISRTYAGFTNTLGQISLNYDNTFGKHHIGALALYEESDRQADNFKAQRNITLFTVEQLDAGDRGTQQASQSMGNMDVGENNSVPGLAHFTTRALVGRVTYDYASKYLAEFSFRYDGSSKFASGHQWGFFPSFFGAWRMSEESFIKDNVSWLNNLKIRASYGILGDDGSAAYQFYPGYNYPSSKSNGINTGYVFGGKLVQGVTSRGVPNTNLSWIESKMLNIGVDAEVWNGLLGVEVDIFKRDRSGLMATRQVSLPGEIGSTVAQENLNSDMTKGLELTLTHRHKIGSDFRYNIAANMALDRTINKHMERARDGNSYRNWRDNPNDRYKDILWGVDYLGQYQNFDQIFAGPVYREGNAYMLPGDLMFGDWNEDGIIDDNDYHPLYYNSEQDNKMKPVLSYGFTIGAEYKGFDLNIVMQGIGTAYRQNDVVNYTEWPLQGGNSNADNGLDVFLDRWHRADQTNPSKWQEWVPGKYPSVYGGGNNAPTNRNYNRDYLSSFFIYNAAYLRMKSLELGYTIPQHITQKIKMEKARIFFNGFNLLTISGVKTTDPEQPERYPLNRSYNFGINVSF
ncbi:MAG: TonB-dependent receptor [Bacteroidales bacterium]|jgi:TonB-linked SusC/RagA family outer membrane protein|nr:TonB-dependent receptor [Bacteroidales bacterium]